MEAQQWEKAGLLVAGTGGLSFWFLSVWRYLRKPYLELSEAAAALGGEMFAYTDGGNFVLDGMVRTKKFPVQSNK